MDREDRQDPLEDRRLQQQRRLEQEESRLRPRARLALM